MSADNRTTDTESPEVLAHKLDCSTWRELRIFADEMRNNWRTEQEMHAAWRKRAMEAEAEIRSLRSPGGARARRTECPYCKRPTDEQGGILHLSGCKGLEDVTMNRLQYDNLLAGSVPEPIEKHSA